VGAIRDNRQLRGHLIQPEPEPIPYDPPPSTAEIDRWMVLWLAPEIRECEACPYTVACLRQGQTTGSFHLAQCNRERREYGGLKRGIVQTLREHGSMTVNELAEALDANPRGIAKALRLLRGEGRIAMAQARRTCRASRGYEKLWTLVEAA